MVHRKEKQRNWVGRIVDKKLKGNAVDTKRLCDGTIGINLF